MPMPPLPPGMEFLGWLVLIAVIAGIVFLITRYSGSQHPTSSSSNPKMEETMEGLLEEIRLLRKEIRELREEFKE
ncbi:MAG: hypothetical protein J7K57_09070 [Palaeococcus sp.]|uniref:hypothetical protein n=1 Tax=Palaeococcus sp. (in: euryarchaeotes) TaxID=2820298 RepID=UPI0025EC37F9|nr:hypothetical protein [Palaeococcus sp. (in: euryarchaeotes)]MCD6559995.1 hypothetical protein [Palaeococcus sp. (in: euryarchaeotes)]